MIAAVRSDPRFAATLLLAAPAAALLLIAAGNGLTLLSTSTFFQPASKGEPHG